MPQSLAKILVHLIYSTKHRERILTDDIREELHRYTAGILKHYESPAILINSVEDHIHILFSQSRNHSLADLVEQVKKGSSKWLKTKGRAFARFHWLCGIEPSGHIYFALSGRGGIGNAINPGRCPGLYYLAPLGRTYPAPLGSAISASLRSLRSFAAKTK